MRNRLLSILSNASERLIVTLKTVKKKLVWTDYFLALVAMCALAVYAWVPEPRAVAPAKFRY
jgi:hypothetical protein